MSRPEYFKDVAIGCPLNVVDFMWRHGRASEYIGRPSLTWAAFCKHAETARWVVENAYYHHVELSLSDAEWATVYGLNALHDAGVLKIDRAFLLGVKKVAVVEWLYERRAVYTKLDWAAGMTNALRRVGLANMDPEIVYFLHRTGVRPHEDVHEIVRDCIDTGQYVHNARFLHLLCAEYGVTYHRTDDLLESIIDPENLHAQFADVRWLIERFDLQITPRQYICALRNGSLSAADVQYLKGRMRSGSLKVRINWSHTHAPTNLRGLLATDLMFPILRRF